MSFINCLTEYEIFENEYAHLMINTHKDSPTFLVYMPKLMATFPMGMPTISSANINTNIFVNDSACKPSVSGSVTTQNFLTMGRYIQRDFKPRADAANILHRGNIFIIRVMEKNIRDMAIIDIK